MTSRNDVVDLPSLDELGRRFEAATARRRPALRSRRTLALAATGLVLVAAPAAAAISGVFDSDGLTVEEALPQVAASVDRDDPAATARALERRGFDVRWQLIVDNPTGDEDGAPPTLGRDVAAPPPGTKILSVLGPDGDDKATPGTRRLLIEVAPADSEILREHE
jgi:hypothetical protein